MQQLLKRQRGQMSPSPLNLKLHVTSYAVYPVKCLTIFTLVSQRGSESSNGGLRSIMKQPRVGDVTDVEKGSGSGGAGGSRKEISFSEEVTGG